LDPASPRTTCGRHDSATFPAVPPEWGREFDLWAKETVEGGDIDAILDFEHTAPAALIAHPRTEHFAPLFVSLGAVADAKVDAVSAVDGFWYGLAKRSFQFN